MAKKQRQQIAESAGIETARRSLSNLKADVDYKQLSRLPVGSPDDVSKLKFLQACEAVGVPREKIPWREKGLVLPGAAHLGIAHPPLTFTLPAFRLMNDNHRSWRRRADKAWREFRDREYGPYLKKCTKAQRVFTVPALKMRFNGAKRNDALPELLRYELAARRYGLNQTWSSLQELAGNYHQDRIRRMITDLLISLELKSVRKRP
jgi:hypothetical protein